MSAAIEQTRGAAATRPRRERRGHHHVVLSRCIGCGACEPACPGKTDAIRRMPDDYLGRFTVDLSRCIDCGFCVPMCPADAIVRLADGERPPAEDSRAEKLRAWVQARKAAAPEHANGACGSCGGNCASRGNGAHT